MFSHRIDRPEVNQKAEQALTGPLCLPKTH
jgi:hypothetical protein